jgi:hypothetical protein
MNWVVEVGKYMRFVITPHGLHYGFGYLVQYNQTFITVLDQLIWIIRARINMNGRHNGKSFLTEVSVRTRPSHLATILVTQELIRWL